MTTHATQRGWLLALAALAPVYWLTLPGGVLANDPRPVDAGTGWAVLLLIPAAWLACITRPTTLRGSLWFLAAFLVAALNVARVDATDTFAAQRTLLAWLVLAASLWIGSRLHDAAGRVALLLVPLALWLAVPALLDGANAYAGSLGNTAATSEALLGALVVGGAWFALAPPAATRQGQLLRALALLACLAGLTHAAVAPVLSVPTAATGAFVLLAVCASGRARYRAAALACLAALAVLLPLWLRDPASNLTGTPAAAAATATAPTSGLSVRWSVVRAGWHLLDTDALAGVGTGQWAARVPQVREVDEIERSTLKRRLGADTEVEHPHNDWLAPLYEGGWLGGLPWLVFLVWLGWHAWQTLRSATRSSDAARAALAAAVLAWLAEAWVRGPFFHNPPATLALGTVAGVILAKERAAPARLAAVLPVSLALLVCVFAARAWDFVQHGRALAQVGDAPATSIEAALHARPDSPLALALDARRDKATNAAPDVQERAWLLLLAQRPWSVEARLNLAQLRIAARDLAQAQQLYASVLALDARHPVAAQNLYTLCVQANDTSGADLAYAALAQREIGPQWSPEWRAQLAARACLRGAPEAAHHEWQRLGGAYAGLTPESALSLSKTLDGELQLGLEAWAQAQWANEHAAAANWSTCLRSLRQYTRVCRTFEDSNERKVMLRTAAAQCMLGEVEAARAALAGVGADAYELRALPPWAREALQTHGLASVDLPTPNQTR